MNNYGLYIHIPFCEKKCYYCDFASYVGKEDLIDRYIDCLSVELRDKTRGKIFDTIFIGGGTPSMLSTDELLKIKSSIDKIEFAKEYEFTIESNPKSITREKVKVLKDMGVNRVSLGLQSSNDSILLDIGRIHTFNDFKESFQMLKEEGIENISVDIIYGLPNETFEIFKKTLKNVVSLKPSHISVYSLIIEENTPFYYKEKKGELNLPDPDLEREMNSYLNMYLEKEGFLKYEISNYTKANMESKHNIKYWKSENYEACGVSAHGYIDGVRTINLKGLKEYINSIETHGHGLESVHINTREEEIEEYIFMGMRLIEGIDKNDFKKRFEASIEDIFEKEIEKYIKESLLISTDTHLRFTEKGLEFSNYVLKDFLLSV